MGDGWEIGDCHHDDVNDGWIDGFVVLLFSYHVCMILLSLCVRFVCCLIVPMPPFRCISGSHSGGREIHVGNHWVPKL